MPVIIDETSTLSYTDQNPPQIPSHNSSTKKKNFTCRTFRGLGCTASSRVSVPTLIRTSAKWESNKASKKQRKFDGENINQNRERFSCTARRIANHEDIDFSYPDHELGMSRPRLDVFGSRHRLHHIRHPSSPGGLAEIAMLQSSLMIGVRSVRVDRYRDLRLDVDNMSYEELLELGDRIGHVSTGLKEDEIFLCLRKSKLPILDGSSSHLPTEMQLKCSVCQEEYEGDEEMGKLDCGHFYHIHCIKQWLLHKKTCPVCKTEVVSQQ